MNTGCKVLNDLWNIALECNIDKPGINGTIDRTIGFVQCKNVRDFMVMATLKCWHEKSASELPPIIIQDTLNNLHVVNKNDGKKKNVSDAEHLQ